MVEPVEGLLKLLLSLARVGLEVLGHHVALHEITPLLLSVGKEPLVAEGNNAFITSTRNNLILRLVVRSGKSILEHVLLDDGLGI